MLDLFPIRVSGSSCIAVPCVGNDTFIAKLPFPPGTYEGLFTSRMLAQIGPSESGLIAAARHAVAQRVIEMIFNKSRRS